MNNKNVTPYPHVNEFLGDYIKEIIALLGDNIIGIYLFGSLSYDDFNPRRSDIDLSVVLRKPLLAEEGEQVNNLHLLSLPKQL